MNRKVDSLQKAPEKINKGALKLSDEDMELVSSGESREVQERTVQMLPLKVNPFGKSTLPYKP